MDRLEFPKNIFNKKTRDYSFAILFFLVFSMFIVFAIKPSLTTAFSLKKEESDLTQINDLYESKISNITDIQNQLETNRDNLYLLDEAVSKTPQVNKIVEDIVSIANSDNLVIKRAGVDDVNLIKSPKSLNDIVFTLEGQGSFDNLNKFIKDLFMQRRLKTIEEMKISKDNLSTSSANLQIQLKIDGYYL